LKHRKQGKKFNKVTSVLAAALLLGLAAVGCSNSEKAPSTAPTPIAAKPDQKPISKPTPSVVEEKPQTAYAYNPLGRRDPFAPIIVKEEKQAKMGDRPPLERFNLYEFKLTGVIWQGFGYNALVEGPDGKGYLVRTGTIMGPNKGVVKKITQSTMIIEEKFKNFSGGTERKEIVIELRKKQEGMQ
jgi:type IV pilus assembly protein PilP